MKELTNSSKRIILTIDLKHNYASLVARELKITNSHTSVLFNVLIKDGLVEYTSKNTRNKYLKLTKKGREIKKMLLQKNDKKYLNTT